MSFSSLQVRKGLLTKDLGPNCDSPANFCVPPQTLANDSNAKKMLLLVITSEQQTAALASMDSELRHLLEEHHVTADVIAVISHLHAKSMITFAKIESDEANVRDWLVNDVGIERAGVGRGIIATVLAVWEMAKQRVTAEGALRVAARAEGRTPEMPPQAVLNLRKEYQAIVGMLKDDEYPSEAYINLKMAQLECGVLRAEVLMRSPVDSWRKTNAVAVKSSR